MPDPTTNSHDHSHGQNRFAVIPTSEKLNADPRFSGRGVRIAFLDSAFYPHPDFVDRVVAFHDISGEEKSLDQVMTPAGHHWHGTQTVTSCAGDGDLSNGLYRGLADGAELVLVKASRKERIGDTEIEAGLGWIIDSRKMHDIRVLNISLGGDCDLPSADSRINSMIEELTTNGVVVTVAAGNSSEMRSLPPASAPSAITVGGYSDENTFSARAADLYHSSFGKTADGVVKPELIAPAMYVAAPILPGTADYRAAETLSMLAAAPDYALRPMLEENWQAAGLVADDIEQDLDAARKLIERALLRRKVVATHYQHVDGTSFAAPIVASVVAQMLEANPNLTPTAIKNILISTAKRLNGHSAGRQGFGIINAPLAVAMAESETHAFDRQDVHSPASVAGKIIFRFHSDSAGSVNLVGDLNNWDAEQTKFTKDGNGIWQVKLDSPPAGKYRYKLLVDGALWTEDPSHGLKEEDGFGGFNSLLHVS